jgi:hypothetical protein
MEREQYEEIRAFAGSLKEKRLQVSDGQLLDQCQQRLDALIEHLADEFEEHPHINEKIAPYDPDLFEPPPEPAHPTPLHQAAHQPYHRKAPAKKGHR